LLETDVDADPFRQFRAWLDEALTGGLAGRTHDPGTVAAGRTARPPDRPVRGFDDAGFVFYTNYDSRKAASWPTPARALGSTGRRLQRQVRVEGVVER